MRVGRVDVPPRGGGVEEVSQLKLDLPQEQQVRNDEKNYIATAEIMLQRSQTITPSRQVVSAA